jgi:serine/threonine protein kinase
VNHKLNERQIAQYLIARNLPGLFELLVGLKGTVLEGRYVLRWLYAVGGQSIIYLAEGPGDTLAIVKLAFLPYHRSAYVSTKEIQEARQRLEIEARLLERFRGTLLPEFYDLIYAPNPLHSSARGDGIVSREPYLVMEFVRGRTLLEVARHAHHAEKLDYDALEWLAWQAASAFAGFAITISNRQEVYLYSDLNPINLILTDSLDNPVRILDAGSLIPLHADTGVPLPFTWAYVPPEYYHAYDKGQMLWPTTHYVMYTLGKTLWEVLTNRQPCPAEDPDLSEPKLRNYSPELHTLISGLVQGRYRDFRVVGETVKLEAAKQISATSLSALLTSERSPTRRRPSVRPVPVSLPPALGRPPQLIKGRGASLEVIQTLRYSPDGRHIALATQSTIELWDSHTLSCTKRLKSSHQALVGLDFDATGRYLASGSAGMGCLWSVDSAQILWEHRGNIAGAVALDGPGEHLAIVSQGSALVFCPQADVQEGYQFEGIDDKCTCVAIAKEYPLLAVGGPDGIQLWDLDTRADVGQLRTERGVFMLRIAIGNEGRIVAALISKSQMATRDATYVYDAINVWSLSSGELLWEREIPGAKVMDLRIGPGEQLVTAVSIEGHLWVWDSIQGTEYAQRLGLGRASSLDFSPDRKVLAVGTFDGDAQFYVIET